MTAIVALAKTETRLLSREWAVMVFAFLFSPLMVAILGGVFGDPGQASPEHEGVIPADYYTAVYTTIPLAALSLIGLPVMLASYRERAVLRRFEAFGVPTLAVVGAQALVTAGLVVLGALTVLLAAAPIYGVPAVQDPVGLAIAFALSTATMITLGVVLGLLAPTARSAQSLGLLVFLPMWLLGGSGPPVGVMSDPMLAVANLLPLWHITAAVRGPWLNIGEPGTHLLVVAGWLVAGLLAVGFIVRRSPR